MSDSKTRYHDLSEPRKQASFNQLGKAFARSSDYLYTHITQDLTDEANNPPEEIYVNRLVLLGVNVFGAALLEHLPRNVIGRTPRPDIALQDFWDELDTLKQAFYDAFDKEVEARVNQALAERTPDDDQRQALEQLAAYDDLMRPIDVDDSAAASKLPTQLPNCEIQEIPNLPEEIAMPKTPKPKHPKIYQVARDLGVKSGEIVVCMYRLGYPELNHHMKAIPDPAIIDQLKEMLAEASNVLTVAKVAIKLNITTDELIADLQEIEHYDLNHPDAEIYDPEIVDHVLELRVAREKSKAA